MSVMKCYAIQHCILFLRVFGINLCLILKARVTAIHLHNLFFFYSGHCKVFNFFHSSESWLLESLLCICGPPGGVLATMVRIFRLIFGSTLSPPIPFFGPILIYLISSQLVKLNGLKYFWTGQSENKQLTIAGSKRELKTHLLKSYTCSPVWILIMEYNYEYWRRKAKWNFLF